MQVAFQSSNSSCQSHQQSKIQDNDILKNVSPMELYVIIRMDTRELYGVNLKCYFCGISAAFTWIF